MMRRVASPLLGRRAPVVLTIVACVDSVGRSPHRPRRSSSKLIVQGVKAGCCFFDHAEMVAGTLEYRKGLSAKSPRCISPTCTAAHAFAGCTGAFHSTPCRLQSSRGQTGATLPKPCNRTRQELDELQKSIKKGELDERVYFFKNVPGTKMFPPRDDLDDDIVRCFTCGFPISEHTSAVAAPPKNELDTFVQLLNSGNVDEALSRLKAILERDAQEAEPPYCTPMQVKQTWGAEKLKSMLQTARENLVGLKPDTEPKAPRVISLRNGTGTGKTHALLAIPKLLGVEKSVYMTYNLDQGLIYDALEPRLAALFRVVLLALGLGNVACGKFLDDNRTKLGALKEVKLMDLAVNLLSALGKSWFIGVDECRRLGMRNAGEEVTREQQVASVLGELAFELEKTGVQCTVMMTTLSSLSFDTASGRKTYPLTLPKPNQETAKFVMNAMGVDLKHLDLVSLVSGAHLRSMVVACNVLEEDRTLDAREVFERTRERLTKTFADADKEAVRNYVIDVLRNGNNSRAHKSVSVELYLDASGAVPPVFCMATFDECDGFSKGRHPAVQVFTARHPGGVTKQLEECAAAYDRLRALFNATAIPLGVAVQNGSRNPEEDLTWWKVAKADKFLPRVDNSGVALFRMQGKRVVRTDVIPVGDVYYLPSARNHPLVDRAFVVTSPNGKSSGLIVCQDKINDDIANAAEALNKAAKLLGLNMPVLCVVHCVGAQTSSTVSMTTPHVVITEADLDKFYTSTFAPAVRYLLSRHKTRDGLS